MTPAGLPSTGRKHLESWLSQFDQTWNDGRLTEFIAKLPPPGSEMRLYALCELIKLDVKHQWAKGRRPRLEGYLHCYPELGTVATASPELILAECEIRQLHGVPVDAAELERRFPNQAAQVRDLLLHHTATRQPQPKAAPPHETIPDQSVPPAKSQPAAAASNPPDTVSEQPAAPRPAIPAPDTLATPPAAPSFHAGDLPEQFGHYRILKKLGQGGMGTVYLALDTRLDRRVAIKVPRFGSHDGPAVLERFYQEVKAVAALDHPNICPVHEASSIGGIHYMTMAYVDGKPLSAFVKGGKPWEARQAALMIRKLAIIVHEAHRKGIVHRDLKPANVMINQRKEPVVMDFGLARRVTADGTRLTVDGQAMGTPAYMAPEQVTGNLEAMGPACDVYSLGVMLYELLAGRLPFRGSGLEMLALALNTEPPRPSEFRRGLDPSLEALCLKAIAKDPRKRFAGALDFANALKTWADSTSVPTVELAAVEPVEVMEVLPADIPSTQKLPSMQEYDTVQAANAPSRVRPSGTTTLPMATAAPTMVAPRPRSVLNIFLFIMTLIIVLPVVTVIATIGGLAWYGSKLNHKDDPIVAEDVAACEKLLREGKPTKQYIDKVGPGRIPIWRAAADRGSPEAQWLLSRCYQEGAGVEKDPERAVELLRKSAAKGNVYAENNIGYCYYKGEGVGKNFEESARWFRKAADKKLVVAEKNLGFAYRDGEGVPQDWVKAREWFEKAGEQGDASAQYEVGLIYFNGQGLDKPNQVEALHWYRRAADGGLGDAQNEVGRCYANGWGVTEDQAEATRWYRRAAEAGNAYGQGNLGRAYLNGEGVEKNEEEAVKWLEKAVAQDVKDAYNHRVFRWNLGIALNHRAISFLDKKDTDNALIHFRRSAEVNEKLVAEVPHHYVLQGNLARNYRGLGNLRTGVKDYAVASTWYIKASDRGDRISSRKLAYLFENGLGVPKNTTEAARLRKLADDQACKTFTIPCTVKGKTQKSPFTIYVTSAFKGTRPLENEQRRLLEDHNATVPNEIQESFDKLYEIARQNNVRFLDLVVYALGTAAADGKQTFTPIPSKGRPDKEKEKASTEYFRKRNAILVEDGAGSVTQLTICNFAKPMDPLDAIEFVVIGLMDELPYLTHLKRLDLSRMPVEDRDLWSLADYQKQLEQLNLSSTNVTDEGVDALTGLKSLTSLNVTGTKVTQMGVDKLKKALPKLKVER